MSCVLLNFIITGLWLCPLAWFVYATCCEIRAPILSEDDYANVVEHLKRADVNEFKKMSGDLQGAILLQLLANPACKVGTSWHFVQGVPNAGGIELHRSQNYELRLLLLTQFDRDKGGHPVLFTTESMQGKRSVYTKECDLQKEFDNFPCGDKEYFFNVASNVTYVSYPPSLLCADRLDRIRAGVADPHFKGILGIKPELLRELKQFCLVKRAL